MAKKNTEKTVPETKKKPAAKPAKSTAKNAAQEAMQSNAALPVHTLRVECVEGPWLDGKCVRFIDVQEGANLYDLHLAILNAVSFDEEFPFHFFTALAPEASRKLIPADADGEVDPDTIDPDVYEEIPVLDHVKAKSKTSLFYAFGSDYDDWIFKVQHTGKTSVEEAGEYYPLVLEEAGEGPDPEQYGNGFDDFAEAAEEFKPAPHRSADDDDDSFGDEEEEDDDIFGMHTDGDEDEDDFFKDDDESDDEGGFDDDDDDEW